MAEKISCRKDCESDWRKPALQVEPVIESLAFRPGVCQRVFAHFSHIPGSASILINRPPTTDRAWNPCCFADTVSYQSVSGTRLADSFVNRYAGATNFSKSPRFSASVAVHSTQSSFV